MSKEFENLAKFIADKGTNSGHTAEALFVLCVCGGIENLYADIGKPTAKDIIDGLKTYSKQDKGSGKVLFSRDIKIKSQHIYCRFYLVLGDHHLQQNLKCKHLYN